MLSSIDPQLAIDGLTVWGLMLLGYITFVWE